MTHASAEFSWLLAASVGSALVAGGSAQFAHEEVERNIDLPSSSAISMLSMYGLVTVTAKVCEAAAYDDINDVRIPCCIIPHTYTYYIVCANVCVVPQVELYGTVKCDR